MIEANHKEIKAKIGAKGIGLLEGKNVREENEYKIMKREKVKELKNKIEQNVLKQAFKKFLGQRERLTDVLLNYNETVEGYEKAMAEKKKEKRQKNSTTFISKAEKFEKLPVKQHQLLQEINEIIKEVKKKIPKIDKKLPWDKPVFFKNRNSAKIMNRVKSQSRIAEKPYEDSIKIDDNPHNKSVIENGQTSKKFLF